MSDLMFTIGGDDRDFQLALERVEGSSAKTAEHTESLLKIQIFKHAARETMALATEALEAYGKTSETARARVAGLREEHDKFLASLGRDITYLAEGKGGVSSWMADFSDKAAAGFHDMGIFALSALHGREAGSPGLELYGQRKAAMDMVDMQDRTLEAYKRYRDEYTKITRDIERGSGDPMRAKAADEAARHETYLKEIGALKADPGTAFTLREWENKRHSEALDQIAREAAAIEDKARIEEAAHERMVELKKQSYDFILEQLDVESRLTGQGKNQAEIDQIHLEYRRKNAELWNDELLDVETKTKLEERLAEAEAGAIGAAMDRQRLDELRSRKYDVLSLSTVADSKTRSQALGGASYLPPDPLIRAAQDTAAATKRAADEASRQVELLKSIDRGIGNMGGNMTTFQ